MSVDFVAFGVMRLVRMPCAVELSVCMDVLGCGCPNSTSGVRMGTANFALMNSAPNYASAAELITALVICEKFRRAPLFYGMSSSLDMKKCPALGFLPWLLIGVVYHCGL